MALQETFIQNLKLYRTQKKLTQNELTLRIDMGANYINGVEQGAFFPKPDVIDRIASALGIRAVQLFDENARRPAVPSEDFADRVTEALHQRLRADIHTEIVTVLHEMAAQAQ